jgi:hypothetical protein
MNTSPTNNQTPTKQAYQPLSEETVQSVLELGDLLRQIHRRLLSEGYVIRNGQILKPDNTNNGG